MGVCISSPYISSLSHLCLFVRLYVTMLNALTQWSESRRDWDSLHLVDIWAGASRFKHIYKFFQNQVYIRITLDELSLAPSDQSDAKLLESEQKHQDGRGDSTYLSQWECLLVKRRERRHSRNWGWGHPKRGEKKRRWLSVSVSSCFVMENPFCDEWQHSHPLAQHDQPIPDLHFSGILILFCFFGAPQVSEPRWYVIAYIYVEDIRWYTSFVGFYLHI